MMSLDRKYKIYILILMSDKELYDKYLYFLTFVVFSSSLLLFCLGLSNMLQLQITIAIVVSIIPIFVRSASLF